MCRVVKATCWASDGRHATKTTTAEPAVPHGIMEASRVCESASIASNRRKCTPCRFRRICLIVGQDVVNRTVAVPSGQGSLTRPGIWFPPVVCIFFLVQIFEFASVICLAFPNYTHDMVLTIFAPSIFLPVPGLPTHKSLAHPH